MLMHAKMQTNAWMSKDGIKQLYSPMNPRTADEREKNIVL